MISIRAFAVHDSGNSRSSDQRAVDPGSACEAARTTATHYGWTNGATLDSEKLLVFHP